MKKTDSLFGDSDDDIPLQSMIAPTPTAIVAENNNTVEAKPPIQDPTPTAVPVVKNNTIEAMPPIQDPTPTAVPVVKNNTVEAKPPIQDPTPTAVPVVKNNTFEAKPPIQDPTPTAVPVVKNNTIEAKPPIQDPTPTAIPVVKNNTIEAKPPIQDPTPTAIPVVAVGKNNIDTFDVNQSFLDPAPTSILAEKNNVNQSIQNPTAAPVVIPADSNINSKSDANNPSTEDPNQQNSDPSAPLVAALTKQEKLAKLNVKIQHLVEVDEVVNKYLVELRTLRLCDGWTLSPRALFGITLFLFFLPSLWSVSEVLVSHQLPEYVFYDRCRNGTGDAAAAAFKGKNSVEFPYDVCVRCAGNTPHVFTNSSTVTFESNAGFAAIVVVVNFIITFIATIFFVRLSIKEFTCIHFLGSNVLVNSGFNFRAICILITTTLLCVFAAAINVAYQYFMHLTLNNIPLGYKLRQNDTEYQCFAGNITSGLYAVFDADNPSIASTFSPHEPESIIAAVLAAFLLYIPIVLRLLGLVTSSFNSFEVKDLMSNSRVTAKIFDKLAFTVEYDDLMKSIADYAETQEPEERSCASVVTRILSMHCNFSDPPADFFGYSWGFKESDMNMVISLLSDRGQLKPFSAEDVDPELANLKQNAPPTSIEATKDSAVTEMASLKESMPVRNSEVKEPGVQQNSEMKAPVEIQIKKYNNNNYSNVRDTDEDDWL